MRTFGGGLKGLAPIMFFKDVGDQAVPSGRKSPEVYEEEARTVRCYRNAQGLYLPAANLKRCLRLGAGMANLKVGRKGADAYLNALVFIEPREIPFGKKEPDLIDKRMGKVPPGPKGNRVMLYRPMLLEGWELSFNIVIFDDALHANIVQQALETAGYMVGLCSGRPEFGRFKVTRWEQLAEAGKEIKTISTKQRTAKRGGA